MRNGFYMNLYCTTSGVGPVYLRGYVKLYENTLPSHPPRGSQQACQLTNTINLASEFRCAAA
jgi:hypothetical protein